MAQVAYTVSEQKNMTDDLIQIWDKATIQTQEVNTVVKENTKIGQ